MERSDLEIQKVQSESKSNGLLYSLIGVVVILLIYIGYIYFSYEMVKKGEKKNESEVTINQEVTFNSLSYLEQQKYITVNEHEQKLDQMEKELISCNEEKNKISSEKEKLETNNIQVQTSEEKVIEKLVEVEKLVYKDEEPIDLNNFVTYRCYDMLQSGYHPSSKCKETLNIFLDKHKEDTKVFEIIGVVDNQDFTLLTKLKDVYKTNRVDRIQEFAQYGLGRKRVIEGTWLVIQHLGKDAKIKTVNYTAKSKTGKKGFVIRAYK